MIPFRALAQLASEPRPASGPRCELCGSPLREPHRHVVELGARGVQCTCTPCAILFSRPDSTARFRTVPERVVADPAFAMTAERWAGLGIPVALAFFFRDSTRDEVVVCYPGAAGVIEAALEPAAWHEVTQATPLAAELAEDVEALLVHGERGAPTLACYLVPISAAYDLAGRLRRTWRGFTGGDEARREVATFFAELDHPRRGHR